MDEEMADSASPMPTQGSVTPSVHAPASSSATPSKASPTPSPKSSGATPKSSASPAAPKETVSGGKTKSAFDTVPFLGPLLGQLLGGA